MTRTRWEEAALADLDLGGRGRRADDGEGARTAPAFPQTTFAEVDPSRTFAGIDHFHEALPARATTAGRRCSDASAYRIDALQRTPVGRTTTEREAGWPWKAF